jgi:2-amino-4-hydroxy-6-hydroxymethyldihydropteridine diphosphokinase
MKRIYLGLGSNLGEREKMLAEAVRALDSPQLRILRLSPVYETEPVGPAGQSWFLNQVAEAETDFFPLQLLHRTSKVEAQLKRRRLAPNGPRTIDIDIVLYGHAVVRTARLEIPHPRMHERRFVLAPLADLAPGLRHPVLRQTVRQLLEAAPPQTVRRIK